MKTGVGERVSSLFRIRTLTPRPFPAHLYPLLTRSHPSCTTAPIWHSFTALFQNSSADPSSSRAGSLTCCFPGHAPRDVLCPCWEAGEEDVELWYFQKDKKQTLEAHALLHRWVHMNMHESQRSALNACINSWGNFLVVFIASNKKAWA